MNPSRELELAVNELVNIAAAKPNDAHTFSMVVERLANWPGMNRDVAFGIAKKNFPGSHRAWQAKQDERQRRLERAIRNGGCINT